MGFMDLREWLAMLEKQSGLRRIAAAVDWDREIGAIARRVLEKKGPASCSRTSSDMRKGGAPNFSPAGSGAGDGWRWRSASHRTPRTRTWSST